jgi:DNA polymerase-1
MALPLLAVDSETFKITEATKAPPLVCVSMSHDGREGLLYHHTDADHYLRLAFDAAANDDAKIVGANFAFDAVVFAAYRPALLPTIFAAYERGNVTDVQIVEKVLDLARGRLRGHWIEDEDTGERERITTGYSLDEISQRRLGLKLDKGEDGWRNRYGELYDVPLAEWPERAKAYAKDDAIVPYRVYRKQMARARELNETFPGLLKPVAAECYTAFCLQLMCAWGMVADADAIDRLEQEVQRDLDGARAAMQATGLIRLGGTKKAPKWVRNTKVIRARVVANLGDAAPLTKTGLERQAKGLPLGPKYVSAAAPILHMTGDAALRPVVQYNQAQKVLTTYVPLLRGGVDHSIKPGYSVPLETGRVSLWKPNLQNIHKREGVRECLVAREGYYLCSVDYDAAELRSWAQVCLWVCGFSRLAQVFQDDPNADPHTVFASMMLGIDPAEGLRRKKAKDPEIKAARQRAKAANFGFPGGMGAAKFIATEARKYWLTIHAPADKREGLNLSLDEGKALRSAWQQMWPEHKPYFKWASDNTEDGEGIARCFGSGLYSGGCKFSDFANRPFQMLTAVGAKASLRALQRACYIEPKSPLFGSRVVNFAHDEIIAELPIDRAHEAAHEMARLMIEVMQRYMPDVPVTASPALMRRWSKAAEAVYVDGRLVPWEPAGLPLPRPASTSAPAKCALCGGPGLGKWLHSAANGDVHEACHAKWIEKEERRLAG